MGAKKNLLFEAIRSMNHVLEKPQNIAGTWHKLFGNRNPITLELACGKGEYTVALAKRFPNQNFVGVDIKGNRLWYGAAKAQEQNLENVFFLRGLIEHIDSYFAQNEIDSIWIVYPDPQLKKRRHKKRLTHPRFLRSYQSIAKPNASVQLKTDSSVLFEFTQDVLSMCHFSIKEEMSDAYQHAPLEHPIRIPTYYEGLDIAGSGQIRYLHFLLHQHPLPLSIDQQIKKKIGLVSTFVSKKSNDQK